VILKHILFPVDFSVQTRAVQNDVEWLARRFGSRVTLLHVAHGVKQNLADYRIDLPEELLTRTTTRGGIAWDIADYSSKRHVDLIVMGTHGYGIVKRFLVGSILDDVLHRAICPVWIRSAHESGSKHRILAVRSVLCAVDVNEEAFPLLRFTKRIAEAFGARVYLLHSNPDAKATSRTAFGFDAALVADEILSLQRQAGTDFFVILATEPVQTAVIRATLEHQVDLIIIGRGLGHRWFDAHAYEIIRQSTCPVLSYSLHQTEVSSARGKVAKAAAGV
jgi:nucleotide-binding universal stress UspA family protein